MTQQPQNGQAVPVQPMPASIRTHLLMGGALYSVDEEVEEVVDRITTFLLGTERALVLTADRRPIAFSRKLVEEAWQVAWSVGRPKVVPVTEPGVVQQLNQRR